METEEKMFVAAASDTSEQEAKLQVSEEDIMNFISMMFLGTKYSITKNVGNLSVTISFISAAEYNEIEKTIDKKIADQEITTKYAEKRMRNWYRAACSIDRVEAEDGKILYKKSEAASPEQTMKLLLKSIGTEWTWKALYRLWSLFDAHCNKIISTVIRDDFFASAK